MQKLRLLFIGYWSINDGLTTSTILPWLRTMNAAANVEQVILCTIERENSQTVDPHNLAGLDKVRYFPLYPTNRKNRLLTKISDFIQFPGEIKALALQEKVTTLFAHGAPAGALAYKVWESIKLPFYVSSFEPHAEYMAESGVWNRWGLKYIFQKYWEEQQKKYASGLIPVSEHYRLHLVASGVAAEKVQTVPSPVDLDKFKLDIITRAKVRTALAWQENLIGIYVGKYGGLYYNDEAFQIYQQCFELIPDFRLIILSPQPKHEILQQLQKYKIDLNLVHVASVQHNEVPAYLSVADFAFATIKSYPSVYYCSPVKIGEYWANGLPVLLTEGVGDDSDIIKKEGGGALFNLQQKGSIEQAIQQIQVIIKDPTHRQEVPKLAAKYRSPEKIREAYEYFFNQQKAQ